MIIRPDPRYGLRALVVRQPYASEILSGEKDIEYRDWTTHYRGDLLITVASARIKGHPGPYGVTMCIVDLYAVDDHGSGPEWMLRKPRAVPQLAIKGALKLWAPGRDVVEALGLEVAPTSVLEEA
jgi:hypothetical protein